MVTRLGTQGPDLALQWTKGIRTHLISSLLAWALCNVARGLLLDESALIDSLREGHLGAAILDVMRHEPLPPDDPLWDAPNTYLSPHSSTSREGYDDRLRDLFARNLVRFLANEPLVNVVV